MVAGALAASAPASAQITWTGNTSDDWFTGTNWSGNAVPLAAQNVIIDVVAPNPTVVRLPGAVSNNLTIGSVGTGSLTIIDGGIVTTGNLSRIGFNAGSQGEVTVAGPGSTWTNGTNLSVANSGMGELFIQAGGKVETATNGLIAQLPGSIGSVDVRDAGSIWSMGASVIVGQGGTGSLAISNGGIVTNVDGRIGENTGATGMVTVDAATWTNAGTLFIGNAGNGELVIVNGGKVSNTEGRVGFQAGSVGMVTVSEPGSSWSNSLDLHVGTAGTGTLTIANGGVVNVAGTTIVAQMAGSTGTLNIGATLGSAPMAPGTLNSPTVEFGAGTGTINFNHTATDYVFAPAISGPGAVNVLAGTTIFTGANTYNGPTLIDGATLKAGAVSTFSPNSVHTVTSTATLDLAGFSQTAAGLINAGLVNFGTDTPPGTVLTVAGNYLGQGGTLAMNTFLGSDGSPSDKLVIMGPTASATGSTTMMVTNAGGAGAQTVANGILVVEANSTTAPGAFTLAGPLVAGPYEYTLFRGGIGGSAPENWFLRSTIDCALAPTNPACVTPTPPTLPGPGPTPSPPNFRQEVSLYAALPALALLYGRTLMDTLHQRVGEQEHLRYRTDIGNPIYVNGAWGRVIGQHGNRDGDRVGIFGDGPKYDFDFMALQAGLDVYRQQLASGFRIHAGVYGAIGDGRAGVTHFNDLSAGHDTFAAYSVGSYWTLFGPTGWYFDSVMQGTWYDMKGQSNRLPALETDAFGYASSWEAGVPFRFGGLLSGWIVEPQAQLVYQSVDLETARDIAATVRFDDIDSLAGRIGVRFANTWAMPAGFWGSSQPGLVTAWFRPNYWHEFSGDPRTLFSSETGFIPFRADLGQAWVELNTGITVQVDRTTSLYANSSYQFGVEGDSDAWGGKIGLRVNW